MRWAVGLLAVLTWLGLGSISSVASAASFFPREVLMQVELMWPALPVADTGQAIKLLNEQRTANGIPGDLVEEPKLSEGCQSWATNYRPAKGQYPHEELPSQPGYTVQGNEAAMSSDLNGEPGSRFTVGTLWGSLFNPWSGAAIHEAGLLNPAVMSVWYGASRAAACMGTSGARSFLGPSFYSVPGPGARNVPIAENTGEFPFSSQEAVGLGQEPYLAPALLLWDEGSSAHLATATLTTAGGEPVPISLVTPETPTPGAPPNFPSVSTFGGYSAASFVVPRVKFKKNMSYVLMASWQGPEGTSLQTVRFTTADTDLNGLITEAEKVLAETFPKGLVVPSLRGHRLSLKSSGIALGHVAHLRVIGCPAGDCEYQRVPTPWKYTVRLRSAITRVSIPSSPSGGRYILTLRIPDFKFRGHWIRNLFAWAPIR
jgi:hypothetical protein